MPLDNLAFQTLQEFTRELLYDCWPTHNFLCLHFTTKEVPAVALGVIDRPLSVQELFLLQVA